MEQNTEPINQFTIFNQLIFNKNVNKRQWEKDNHFNKLLAKLDIHMQNNKTQPSS